MKDRAYIDSDSICKNAHNRHISAYQRLDGREWGVPVVDFESLYYALEPVGIAIQFCKDIRHLWLLYVLMS